MCRRSCERANDAKIVRCRDAQKIISSTAFLRQARKHLGDGGLNGRSFDRGKSTDNNLRGRIIDSFIAEGGESIIRVFWRAVQESGRSIPILWLRAFQNYGKKTEVHSARKKKQSNCFGSEMTFIGELSNIIP